MVGVRVAGAGGEEEVKACIVRASATVDASPRAARLVHAPECPARRAPLRRVVVARDKTPTGKLQKVALREAGVTDSTWDRESVGYVVRR